MQFQYVPIGYHDRYDTLYLYTPAEKTVAFVIGAKYEQREVERFPAANMQFYAIKGRFLLKLEGYGKYLYDYEAAQGSWNVLTSILLVPKVLMFAADMGGFRNQDFRSRQPDSIRCCVDRSTSFNGV
ncbi:MAG: hypothetical protein R3A47_04995 [Polyangiales bacterium]